MNNFDQELMIPVEEIMRPVQALVPHKMRMREELYSHLHSIYLEEQEKHPDEATALAQSIERLGDPESLRADLQATISKSEQLLCRYNALFARDQTKSRLRFALKIGACSWMLQASSYTLAVFISTFVFQEKEILAISPMLCVISFLIGWNTFIGIFLSQPFIELRAFAEEHRRRLPLSGFYFGLSVGISEALMWLSIPGEFEYMNVTAPQVILPILAGWGMFCLVVWLTKTEIAQTAPWELLQLGD